MNTEAEAGHIRTKKNIVWTIQPSLVYADG